MDPSIDHIVKAVFVIVAAVLAYFHAASLKLAKAKGASESTLTAMNTLFEVGRVCTAHAEQTVVADLKDPSKPGTWDEKAMASVRRSVGEDVRDLAQGALVELGRAGYSPRREKMLVDRAIEAGVAALKRRSVPGSTAPSSDDVRPSLSVVPPAPIEPAPAEPTPPNVPA